jgi:hypothetical protein
MLGFRLQPAGTAAAGTARLTIARRNRAKLPSQALSGAGRPRTAMHRPWRSTILAGLTSRSSEASGHEAVLADLPHRDGRLGQCSAVERRAQSAGRCPRPHRRGFDRLRSRDTQRGLQLRAAANDSADADVADARRWRNLAARARRAAGWVGVRDEALLTRLAEEYEARARLAEDRQRADA